MGEQLSVNREIKAPADQVWAMVSDVTRMRDWSPENVGGAWKGGATAPTPGARFRGRNQLGSRKWNTACAVTEAEPGQVFAFRVTVAGMKIAEWRYTFEPTESGCRVTETWIDQRNRLMARLGKPVSGVADRVTHNKAGMETTLEKLAAAAEGT